jgi:hypothetical protein
MIDLNKTYKLRSGHPVRLLCTDANIPAHPIVGLVRYSDGFEGLFSWATDGKSTRLAYDEHKLNPYDLIESKEETSSSIG